ncbi:cytosolic beta-glucosidase-like isoform X1 [Leguminivora glycinivorella]|uniref:cytosolic beta-glucosidase-like isoform X1 n=1 Tax=Leguminivora glycinivorella TaxID=1035111 RepID=UPI00200F2D3D|nr:cytosolic beta-glucosidase-like isoform X1 [Leguminivora glycinivorella]
MSVGGIFCWGMLKLGVFMMRSSGFRGEVGLVVDAQWPIAASKSEEDEEAVKDYLASYDYAPGFHSLLLYLKDTYNNPIIVITESGFPLSPAEDLGDEKKVDYMRNYLNALLDARADGVNCIGYFFWSLMDSFEWASGYGYKFGLYQVDFENPHRKATARKSALVYKEIIRTGMIDARYDPDPYCNTTVF